MTDRFQPVAGDWTAALAGRFDIIVSNPPYIPAAAIATLAPEVRCHDPHAALDGGDDGLAAYRALAPLVARHIAPCGVVALEVGAGQAQDVAALLAAETRVIRGIRADLAGIARCVVAGQQPG
jgi:release factor glutamine methyltransferase